MTEGKKSNAVLYWILGIIGAVIVIAVVLILLLRKKKKDDDSTNYGNTSMDTTEKGAGWDVATAAVKSLGGLFANKVASGLSRDEKIQACSALLIDLKKIPASKKAESERALAKLTNAELNTVLKKLSNDKKQVVDPRVNEKVSAIITKYRFSINL
jgi:hypothetical protein